MRKMTGVMVVSLAFGAAFLHGGMADWVQTKGPASGGVIQAFHVSGSKIFAGTQSNGVFISQDSGETWTEACNGLGVLNVTAFAERGDTLFAGTNRGVYFTTNNGLSWASVSNGLANLSVTSLASIGNAVFAGTGNGIYQYNDNGIIWTKILSESIYSLTVIGNNIFAGTYSGIYFSSNYGVSWTKVNSDRVSSFAASGTRIFGLPGQGIISSIDGGASWTAFNPNDSDFIFKSFAVVGNTILAATDNGVYRSPVDGGSWIKVGSIISKYPIVYNSSARCLTVLGNTIIAGTCGEGVFRSIDNGANWRQTNAGLINLPVRYAAVYGNYIFIENEDLDHNAIIHFSDGNSTSWSVTNSGFQNQNDIPLAAIGNTVLAGTRGGIFRCTGNEIQLIGSGLPDTNVQCFTTNGNSIYAGTWRRGVFLSNDSGKSWTAIGSGIIKLDVRCMAVTGTTIVVSALSEGLYLSNDNGASWVVIDTGTTDSKRIFFSLVASKNTFFAGTWGNGISRSTDLGKSWTTVNSGLTSKVINSLAASGNTIFAGTRNGGVFLSSDNGDNWVAVNDGFKDSTSVNYLTISGGTIYAGTETGLWHRTLSEMITKQAVGRDPLISKGVSLNIHFPVGTDPRATVVLSLSKSSLTTIKVYTLSGREITTLVDRHLGPGIKQFTWDTRRVATGLYTMKFHTGEGSLVRYIPVFR